MKNYEFQAKVVCYCYVFLLMPYSLRSANNDSKVQFIGGPKIVLDAGHGGHDSGAKGRIATEKDITVSICTKIAQILLESMPSAEIIQTRSKDEFIPLHRRSEIANENLADLFISVHCNASTNIKARGTETYVMGIHKLKENLWVAKRENQSIHFEEDATRYEPMLDTETPEAHILLSQFQNQYLSQSLSLASYCEEQFRLNHPGGSRGVKQAGFLVLHQANMPSILVEVGYLSNPTEEIYLASEAGQIEIAMEISQAIVRYFVEKPFALKAKGINTTNRVASGYDLDSLNQELINKSTYQIQIAASKSCVMVQDHPAWQFVPQYDIIQKGELYQYVTGHFDDKADAAMECERLKQIGFSDAFIIKSAH